MSRRCAARGLFRLRFPTHLSARPSSLVLASFVLASIAATGVRVPSAEARPGTDERFLLSPLGAPMGETLDRPLTATANARPSSSRVLYGPDPTAGVVQANSGGRSGSAAAYGDTLAFGYVDGDGFAVLGETWTFDHGGPDPLEGWVGVDVSAQDAAFGRQIDATSWNADPYNDVAPPILSGSGSAWIGAFGSEARALCFDSGLGYGNSWGQRLVSPTYVYDGASDITLQWTHFNDTEENFDYTRVYLERFPSGERSELREYTEEIGLAPDHPSSPPVGVVDALVLTSLDLQGDTTFQIVFEMTSDGSWSDEDHLFETEYGPCAFDDVTVSGFGPAGTDVAVYGFESDLEGWTAEPSPGFGTFLGVASSGDYILEDTCQCDIQGNVLEMHDDNEEHPYGQHIYALSPPVDVLNDVNLPGTGPLSIFADWTEYLDLPRVNGVFIRAGWQYYPWVCDITGEIGWSPRVGQDSEFFWWDASGCVHSRSSATFADNPVPEDAEQLRFLYELYATCDLFGIPPEDCSGITNFTPILDNLQIRFTRSPEAPAIFVDNGLWFQDGFAESNFNDPTRPGRADVTRNVVGFGNSGPYVQGDSLAVVGPLVTTPENRWEASLWFRVARTGPLAGSWYTTWRDQVNTATGVDIEAGQFAEAAMDSAQIGTNAFKHRFASYLKEEDWAAWGRSPSGPELTHEVEIIQDDVLYPGTKVEYFLTANFIDRPDERYLLPDTSGGFFNEFEILPSWREIEGEGLRHPCLLYVDAFNANAQPFLEAAFDSLGYDVDRYDYLDATSNWKTPMARGRTLFDMNGASLFQLLGYRGLLVNSGSSNISQLMWPEDYLLFSDWLTAPYLESANDRQGLLMNGDGIAYAIEFSAPALLPRLGASFVDDTYSDYSGDYEACVRIESPAATGEAYGTANSAHDYVYDAYGNWCPQQFRFDVLGTVGGGVGNRVYVAGDGVSETEFAQVAVENVVPDGFGGYVENYRAVLDGISWHHLASPEPGNGARCVSNSENVAQAAFDELAAAIEWIYEVDYGDLAPFLCLEQLDDIVSAPGDALGPASTRLFAGTPNPFNPRTTIRFNLAVTGPVELAIYDVAGRKVRTLVNTTLEAGPHDAIWDGTDDRAHSSPAAPTGPA
ncbi:MAG: hypothetical protein R3E97_09000 [Candidatus Eisenbacteria bacterium]